MRILVVPHQMCMGGSQINALELAAAVRDRGHEVIVYAPGGVLDPMVDRLGLRRVHKTSDSDVSLSSIKALIDIVRRESIDLVHAYEWGPSIESAFGPHLRWGVPMLTTVLSMDVPGFLPRHLPMTVGTEELRERHRNGWASVQVIEPPIDTSLNRPSGMGASRAEFGYSDQDIVIGTVCRLTNDLGKLPGTLEAMAVVGALAHTAPVRLLVVGDGPGIRTACERAAEINAEHDARIIAVVGAMLDPTSAYDCADVMVGMGSSALKSLAFAKPLVVQGEHGFWKLLTESTIGEFYHRGWFGHSGRGEKDLFDALGPLIANPARRLELGRFGHDIIAERFAIDVVATGLVKAYEQVLAEGPGRDVRGLARSAARTAKFGVHRWRHTKNVDHRDGVTS